MKAIVLGKTKNLQRVVPNWSFTAKASELFLCKSHYATV